MSGPPSYSHFISFKGWEGMLWFLWILTSVTVSVLCAAKAEKSDWQKWSQKQKGLWPFGSVLPQIIAKTTTHTWIDEWILIYNKAETKINSSKKIRMCHLISSFNDLFLFILIFKQIKILKIKTLSIYHIYLPETIPIKYTIVYLKFKLKITN